MSAGTRPTHAFGGLLAVAALVLVACGDESTGRTAGGAFPMTIENCGRQVVVERPPERVVVIGDNPLSLLASAGALDKVVALAAELPLEIYTQDIRDAVGQIPPFGAGEGAGGSAEVSLEEVINKQPDLVVGSNDGADSPLTPEALGQAGIPFLVLPSFCGENGLKTPGFEDVYSQVELYGRLFGNEDVAAAAVADLRQRVAVVEESVKGSSGGSAAVLFQNVSSGAPGAYGADSMSAAQLRTLGLSNIFGDVPKRYFEPSVEEIISGDPDVLILLHTDGATEEIRRTFLATPGVDRMKAVRNNNIFVLRFEFTDPPTPAFGRGTRTNRQDSN